jgi:hypothetical protein
MRAISIDKWVSGATVQEKSYRPEYTSILDVTSTLRTDLNNKKTNFRNIIKAIY